MNKYLIKKYRKALSDKSSSNTVDLSKVIDIDFNFQIHEISSMVKEFNGNMPPSRFPQHVIAVIQKGNGQKQIGIHKFNIMENMVFYIPKNSIHSSQNWDLDTEGYMLSFSDSFFNENRINIPIPIINLLSRSSVKPYKEISEEKTFELINIFKLITFEAGCSNDLYRDELITIKVIELLYRYLRIFELISGAGNNHIFDNFVEILEKHYMREKSVSFYSEELNIHPNYLNKIVKKITGETAKTVIKNRVIIEAKYLLSNTSLSMKEISYKLGFLDQNSFSRYFKQSESISLQEYKKNI